MFYAYEMGCPIYQKIGYQTVLHPRVSNQGVFWARFA
jgi:hypothetical protein